MADDTFRKVATFSDIKFYKNALDNVRATLFSKNLTWNCMKCVI